MVGLFHGGCMPGDADAIGNEIKRVFGAHHALAQTAGDKGLQVIQDARMGGGVSISSTSAM